MTRPLEMSRKQSANRRQLAHLLEMPGHLVIVLQGVEVSELAGGQQTAVSLCGYTRIVIHTDRIVIHMNNKTGMKIKTMKTGTTHVFKELISGDSK